MSIGAPVTTAAPTVQRLVPATRLERTQVKHTTVHRCSADSRFPALWLLQ